MQLGRALARSAARCASSSSFSFSSSSSFSSAAAPASPSSSLAEASKAMGGHHGGADDKLPSLSRALFDGKLATASAFPYPRPSAAAQADLRALVEPTEGFYASSVNDAARNDETASIPEATRQGLREFGAYGMQVPEQYGGGGASNTAYGRMGEVLGANDLGLSIHLGAHQSIGFKGILLFGDEAMKAKYLPRLASGEMVAAFALTEHGAGSDANSAKTRATRQPDGSFRLSGSKLWISNGGEAGLFTVFAQTEVEDAKAPGGKADRMTAFVVERAFGGVTNGPPEKKMGIRCSNTAEVFFDAVPVPAENVIGGVGGGFKVAMEILNNGRFGMGCMLSGTMKAVIRGVAEHAAQRSQFGRKLADFGAVQGRLAAMAARTYAAESLAYLVAANMDRGQKDFLMEAAISKVFASEAAWFVADEGIQLMGGLGFMRALPYERIQRDLRIFRIFEGTNDVLRLLIAGQGLGTRGRTLRGSPLAAAGAWLGLKPAAPRLGVELPAPLQAAGRAVEEGVGAFSAACSALLLKHGKKIEHEQLLLEKVADVCIDLTVATATLSRAAARAADTGAAASGPASAAEEMAMAALFCAEADLRVRANIEALRAAAAGRDTVGALKLEVARAVRKENSYRALHPTGV